jgi:hypothetical protein
VSANGEELEFTIMRHRPEKPDKRLGRGTFLLEKAGFGVIHDAQVSIHSCRTIVEKVTKDGWTVVMPIRVHIVAPLGVPFVASPFVPLRLSVIVIEAVNVPSLDVELRSDPYCMVKLERDVAWKLTTVQEHTLTPQWCQTLRYWILGPVYGDIILNVRLVDHNVTIDRKIGETKLSLGPLQPGMLVKGWYDVPGASESVKLNLAAQLVAPGDVEVDPKFLIMDPVPEGILLPSAWI